MFRLLFLSFFLVSCTTVKITDKHGSVSVTREFGVVYLTTNQKEGAVYADVTLLGYATTPLGQVIGYSKQSISVMSEECKLVLWVDDSTNASVIKDLLQENESICIVNRDNQKE